MLHGLLVLERGYIFTCMILAAIAAFLIDRKFYTAAVWSLIAATFAALGLTHAYQVSGNVVDFLFIFADPRPAPGNAYLRHRGRLSALRGGFRRFRLVRGETPRTHDGDGSAGRERTRGFGRPGGCQKSPKRRVTSPFLSRRANMSDVVASIGDFPSNKTA